VEGISFLRLRVAPPPTTEQPSSRSSGRFISDCRRRCIQSFAGRIRMVFQRHRQQQDFALLAQHVCGEVEERPCSAPRCRQLTRRDWDQPVLRGVFQVEQLDQSLGRSSSVGNDLAKESSRFAMIFAA